jgi:hypothetical protein
VGDGERHGNFCRREMTGEGAGVKCWVGRGREGEENRG